MPKNTLPRSRRAAAPNPQQPVRLDPHGATEQRKALARENRKLDQKELFESRLQEYIDLVRRQFQQGFTSSAGMFCAVDRLTREEKDWRIHERMEAFEANRAATGKLKKGAARA